MTLRALQTSSLLIASLSIFSSQAFAKVDLSAIKQKIENFKPEQVPEAPIDVKLWSAGPQTENLAGFESDVRFGTYNNQEVAVKFFKKRAFEIRHNGVQLTKSNYVSNIKQSYFMLDTVHQLGFAAKPVGYATDQTMEALARESGFSPAKYHGAIIMERLHPIASQTGRIPYDPALEKQIHHAFDTVREVGLVTDDVDYIIDQKKHFYFLDLDSWLVKSREGAWRYGQRDPLVPPHCKDLILSLIKVIFQPSP